MDCLSFRVVFFSGCSLCIKLPLVLAIAGKQDSPNLPCPILHPAMTLVSKQADLLLLLQVGVCPVCVERDVSLHLQYNLDFIPEQHGLM